MKRRGLIDRIRAGIATLFGVRSEHAVSEGWWELDLLFVMLAGAFALGVMAYVQL